ncbi:hypothetical protein [Kitasatospora azatica]|uniref:hypothetical protein n=1 Tax=Kitasatospora azatica TaxID=58347 RepID=UPI0012F9B027|nr:hypothetical protein [Kitasatospora azatica]
MAEEIPEALPEAVPAEQVELATGTYDGPSGPSGPSPTVASAKPPGGKPPLRVVQGGRNPPADLPAAGPRTAAPPARPPRAPKKAVARTPEDEYQDFLAMLREEGATGEVVAAGERLSLAPYAKAAEARAEIGAPPGTQGLHLFPDAVGKHIPGFKKDAALVLLEPRAINTEMDAGWKLAFQRMQAEGRATATAWEVHNAVSESIGAAAHLSPGVKASLQLRLQDEMFIELGLDPAQELILPYANFYKPKP